MSSTKDSWIEQIYQYVEHYYWCPQDLNKQSTNKVGGIAFQEVRARMRRYEVPLNAIFNITLRLLPSRILINILSLFSKGTFGQNFTLIDVFSMIPEMGNFVQPDIALETENTRIFIETKVKHSFTLKQIYKYIFLHAWLNQRTRIYKQPFILLLSPKNIDIQWDNSDKNEIFREDKSIDSLLIYLNKQNLPMKLGNLVSTEFLHEDASKVLETLILGSTTWHTIGDYLNQELNSISQKNANDNQEVIYKLIADLLSELKNRQLYSTSGR